MIRVNFGSGPLRLPGWINVDLDASTRPDVVADLTRGLPFATGSVDYVFAEDFIATSARGFAASCASAAGSSNRRRRARARRTSRLARMYLKRPRRSSPGSRSVGVPVAPDRGEVVNLA
jgi:hypothetical protein